MKLLPLASLFLVSMSALAQEPAQPAQPAQPGQPAQPVRTLRIAKPAAAQEEKPVYDEAADAKAVVAAAIAHAKKENKRVLIQWGANWCGWCKWLAGTMKRDGKIAHEISYEYELVHVDVGRFDKNKDLAKDLGAEFKAIPYLTILDGNGVALVQQNTEPFEAKIDGKDGHDPAKILEFLKKYEAKPLVAQEVFAAALATAKKEHKRVFLHFGAPWCGWCHRLENWMAQPEIAALLAKDFVDTKIDNDRMSGGKEFYEAQLAAAGQKPTGIPWFVFLDENGKMLAQSVGPKGNTGFPYQPEEVDYFVTMLNTAKQNLTDADVAALKKSLDDNRENDKKKAPAAGH